MRRVLIATSAALAAATVTAALAWACTPQAYIELSRASASPGGTVTVRGRGFIPREVQIRWNGSSGPLLAKATGPDFSVEVTVPREGPGTYYPHAVARGSDGLVVGDAHRPLRVLGTAVPDASLSPASGKGEARARTEGRSQRSGASPGTRGAAPGSGAPRGTRGAAPGSEGPPGTRRATPGSGASAPARAKGGGAAGPVRGVSPEHPVTADAPSSAEGSSSAPGGAAPETGEAPASPPSARAATADLWSGFASGEGPALLSGAPDTATPGAGPGGQLVAGATLLGLALVAVLAGLAVQARRRRAGARP